MAVLSLKQITTENQKPGQKRKTNKQKNKTAREESVCKDKAVSIFSSIQMFIYVISSFLLHWNNFYLLSH